MPTLRYYSLPDLTALAFDSLQNRPLKSLTEVVKTFLQGQLTCDINDLSTHQSRIFAHCNLQGRVVTLGRVAFHQESYLLIIPKSITESARQHLEKYAKFSRLTVHEKTDLHFFGLSSDERLTDFPQTPDESLAIEDAFLICLQSQPYRWLGFHAETSSWLKCLKLENHLENEWLCEEIQSHSPFLTPETVGKFLPHDLDLPAKKGVSFHKGCFLGQEIVARMEHLGKLKKKMEFEIIPIGDSPAISSDKELICQAVHPVSGLLYQLTLH